MEKVKVFINVVKGHGQGYKVIWKVFKSWVYEFSISYRSKVVVNAKVS